jgi:hypothetical protein
MSGADRIAAGTWARHRMKNMPAPLLLIIAILLLSMFDLVLNDGSWLKALDAYANDLLWKIGPI